MRDVHACAPKGEVGRPAAALFATQCDSYTSECPLMEELVAKLCTFTQWRLHSSDNAYTTTIRNNMEESHSHLE